jgi:hypothetical protein
MEIHMKTTPGTTYCFSGRRMHTFWKLLAYRLTNTLVKEKKAADTPAREEGTTLTEEVRQLVQDLGYTGDVEHAGDDPPIGPFSASPSTAPGKRIMISDSSLPTEAGSERENDMG